MNKNSSNQSQEERVFKHASLGEGQGVGYSLLFICLGNICRSPAAEGVMKHIVEREGREADFVIDSAGIGGWHVG